MKIDYIKIDKFKLIDITECNINKSINNHSTATIKGHINPEYEEEYIRTSLSDGYVTVQGSNDDGETYVLFKGIIKDFTVMNQVGSKSVTISLISGTYLMDLVENTKTFQNISMTYEEVIKKVLSSYRNKEVIMNEGDSDTLGKVIVQYKETDWEFIKRLASNMNSYIYPYYRADDEKFVFGINNSQRNETIDILSMQIKTDTKQYINKIKNGVSLLDEDANVYIIKSRDVLEIGDSITYNGKIIYVSSVISCLEGAQLVFCYHFKTKMGLKEKTVYNEKIIGASLEATIIDISADKVKVTMKGEELQDTSTATWFLYSTIYSSPDGTGWYCMPEKGDSVRLYFPNDIENNAYIISAVHMESSDSAARSNPDEKSIKTKYGKEILFKPDSLLITNNKGMSIELNDKDGISIISNKAIHIAGDDSVTISSIKNSLQMVAKEQIQLKQNESYILLKDDITLDGGKVKTV